MGQIKVDRFGRFYETSSDREDGKGYKSHAKPVTQGDVTFGAVHSRSLANHSNAVRRDMHNRMIEDRQAQMGRQAHNEKVHRAQMGRLRETALRDNEEYQRSILRRAAMQGAECKCQNNTVNDHTQRAIKATLSGQLGAFPVDPVEAYQAQMKQIAQSQIRSQAHIAQARRRAGK